MVFANSRLTFSDSAGIVFEENKAGTVPPSSPQALRERVNIGTAPTFHVWSHLIAWVPDSGARFLCIMFSCPEKGAAKAALPL
jgi:hypothetical protein